MKKREAEKRRNGKRKKRLTQGDKKGDIWRRRTGERWREREGEEGGRERGREMIKKYSQ